MRLRVHGNFFPSRSRLGPKRFMQKRQKTSRKHVSELREVRLTITMSARETLPSPSPQSAKRVVATFMLSITCQISWNFKSKKINHSPNQTKSDRRRWLLATVSLALSRLFASLMQLLAVEGEFEDESSAPIRSESRCPSVMEDTPSKRPALRARFLPRLRFHAGCVIPDNLLLSTKIIRFNPR